MAFSAPANSGGVPGFRGSGGEPPRAPRTHSTAAVTGLPGPEGRRASRVSFLLSSAGLEQVAGGKEAGRVSEVCPALLQLRYKPRSVTDGFPLELFLPLPSADGRNGPASAPPLCSGGQRGLEWGSEQLRHPQPQGHQKAPTWLVTPAPLRQALATRLTNGTRERGAVPRRPSWRGPGPGEGQCRL